MNIEENNLSMPRILDPIDCFASEVIGHSNNEPIYLLFIVQRIDKFHVECICSLSK